MFTPLLTVAILSTGLICQDPEPAKGKGSGKAVQEAAANKDTLQTWDDKQAKAALEVFKKEYKAKTLEQKLLALEKLRSGKHKMLIKPLTKVVKTERKFDACRILAAELLGNQDNMRKRLLFLMKDSKLKRTPVVLAALIRAYSKGSYDSKDWKDFKQLFYKDIADRRYPKVQKAIVQMVGENKELGALDMLADSMEGPQPAWVDDPNNPPASYWEARWRNWEVWRLDAKESLLKITGQRFTTIKAAKAWVSKNRRKLQQEANKGKKKKRGRKR